MPSANLGMRIGTETTVGVGAEVEINIGIETGEKTDRAGKGPQQKMEDRSCMINLTLGNLALGQPFVIQASRRNYPTSRPGSVIARRSPQGKETGPVHNPPGAEEKLRTSLVEVSVPSLEPCVIHPTAGTIRGTASNIQVEIHDDVVPRVPARFRTGLSILFNLANN